MSGPPIPLNALNVDFVLSLTPRCQGVLEILWMTLSHGVNILGFVDHRIYVSDIQCCSYKSKAATDIMEMNACVAAFKSNLSCHSWWPLFGHEPLLAFPPSNNHLEIDLIQSSQFRDKRNNV